MLKKIAQNIAKSASEVIGKGVLVTDEKGIIIGCSDESRLGDLHGPSIAVMKNGRPAVTSQKDASGLAKVKPGYTLPIQLFDKVIGSVSIAGLPEEVERYGLLVQKQAEIMLREQAYLESSLVREQALRNLVENVGVFDGRSGSQEIILTQARELGYNLSRCRIAAIFEMRSWGSGAGEASFQKMTRELHAAFSNPRNVICVQPNYRATMFFSPSGGEVNAEESFAPLVDAFISNMKSKSVEVRAASGFWADGLDGLANSLRSARNAIRIGGMLGVSGAINAEKFTAEMLVDQLPLDNRAEFARRTLGPITDRGDYSEIRDTFFAWCESPFASGDVAKKMAMHRNSLQYRLKKIRQITGKDPWNFKDAFELWAAFVITELKNSSDA